MTLIKDTLTFNFEKFMDQESSNFISFPKDNNETAESWANAVNEYAKLVIPSSVSGELAKQEFKKIFLGISADLGNGDIIIKSSFTIYASTLAIGMTAGGFTGTPPPAPIDFSPIYPVGLGGASNKICMDLMINIIDVWFRTGTAVPISGGSLINWN